MTAVYVWLLLIGLFVLVFWACMAMTGDEDE
jgi:hypothetical protein